MTADSGDNFPVLIHDRCLTEVTKDHLGYESGKLAPVAAKVRDPGGTSRRLPKWLPYLLSLGPTARLCRRLRAGAQTPGILARAGHNKGRIGHLEELQG